MGFDLSKKKICVTGGAGFLGGFVVQKLVSLGVPAENIFIPNSRDYDLREKENCEKVAENQDIIIHLAAKVGGIGFNQQKPAELFYDNAIIGINLMEAARLAGIEKFVTIGTVCSYPKFTPTPFKEDELWNGYPEETNAPYGLAKKMLLAQSQAYRSQYRFNAIYLLQVNLYGPNDNFNSETSHVIPAIIKKVANALKNKEPNIELWGDGSASREFLFVEDAAEGIARATECYNKLEPINLGSGEEIYIKNLAKLICDLMDFKGEIRYDRSKPNGQPRRCLDIEKAKKEFGFQARTSLKEGLKKTIEWYLVNRC